MIYIFINKLCLLINSKMGNKRRNKNKSKNNIKSKINKINFAFNKGLSKITNKIDTLKFKEKVITTIIKPKNLLNKLPVPLCNEYINLFGTKYPDSLEDLNDVIEIILIQYNRLIKSDDLDVKLLDNLKLATSNLCRIINYFIFDNEIVKLLKILDMMEDKHLHTYSYLKEELNNIYSQLRRSEHKVYLLMLNRLKNKNIQQRYIDSYNKYKNEKIVSKEENTEEIIDLDKVLNDLDNLNI